MRKIIYKLPEMLILLMVFIYWYDSATILNPIVLMLSAPLVLLLVTNNKIIQIITSVIYSLISLYMILAVISEFREFEVGDSEGTKLLTIGLSIFVTTFVLSVIIGIKKLFMSTPIKDN